MVIDDKTLKEKERRVCFSKHHNKVYLTNVWKVNRINDLMQNGKKTKVNINLLRYLAFCVFKPKLDKFKLVNASATYVVLC